MAKILVVDDSETLREHVKNVLKGAGHEVVEAENGLVGLAQLKNNNGIQLILCDVNMPEMDGITMCSKVFENADLKTIPIFMLTTESSPELKERGKSYGVKAWVTKPFKEEILLAAIKKVLGL